MPTRRGSRMPQKITTRATQSGIHSQGTLGRKLSSSATIRLSTTNQRRTGSKIRDEEKEGVCMA